MRIRRPDLGVAALGARERLVSAGLALFLKQGYNATGIQQIATRAGAPKGSFYNHFSSKETFGAAIIEQYSLRLKEVWDHIMNAAPQEPDAAIKYMFEQLISYHEQNDKYLGCLVGNFSAEVSSSSEICREYLVAAQDAWCERLAHLIESAQDQGKVTRDINAQDLSSLISTVWTGSLLRMKREQSVKPLHDNIGKILELIFTDAAETEKSE